LLDGPSGQPSAPVWSARSPTAPGDLLLAKLGADVELDGQPCVRISSDTVLQARARLPVSREEQRSSQRAWLAPVCSFVSARGKSRQSRIATVSA
jgi:hypothetical protein